MSKFVRLFEHPDTRATMDGEEGGDVDVDAHGWGYSVGDVIRVDDAPYIVDQFYGSVMTGDPRGNYVVAELAPGI